VKTNPYLSIKLLINQVMFRILKDILTPTPPVKSKRPLPIPEKTYIGHVEVLDEGDPKSHMSLDNSFHHTWTSPYNDDSRRMCSTCGRYEKKLNYHTKTGIMK